MTYEEFNKKHPVSHETFSKLEEYISLLNRWQKSINLISKSTLSDAWNRHIMDSIQINAYIEKGIGTVADLGSGAGFPGMVLALVNRDIRVSLIESDTRKCEFLREIRRVLNINVDIINKRIESLSESVFDCIVSRAFASVNDILEITKNIVNKKTVFILLKSEKVEEEIKSLDIKVEIFKSSTDERGRILKFGGINK